MSVQGDGTPPGGGSFSKATVDRWQVFGGMAGVAALLLSVVGSIQNLVPFSLIAAGVVTVVGVALLYRWGRRPQQHVARHFVVPVALTIVGAATAGVLGGMELRPTTGTAQPGANPSTTTTTRTTTAPVGNDRSSTPAATSTTGTPAAGQPDELRVERIILSWSYAIDFDAPDAENGGVTQDMTTRSEVEYIGGLRARDLAVASGKPLQQDCARITQLLDYVPEEKLVESAAFCVKTSEGRWSRIVVVKAVDNALEFDLVVWEKS
jgi:hypothetical protein